MYVHMFSPCSAKRRASDKDLPVPAGSSTNVNLLPNLFYQLSTYTVLWPMSKIFYCMSSIVKGQIKLKADWCAVRCRFSQKQTNGFVFFFAIKISIFKYFQNVKQKKQIGSFGFGENLLRANLLTVKSNLQTDQK